MFNLVHYTQSTLLAFYLVFLCAMVIIFPISHEMQKVGKLQLLTVKPQVTLNSILVKVKRTWLNHTCIKASLGSSAIIQISQSVSILQLKL